MNELEDFENNIYINENNDLQNHEGLVENKSEGITFAKSSVDSNAIHVINPDLQCMHSYPNFLYPFPPYAWYSPLPPSEIMNNSWYYPYELSSAAGDGSVPYTPCPQQLHFNAHPYIYALYPPYFAQHHAQNSPNLPSYAPNTPPFSCTCEEAPKLNHSCNSSRASSLVPEIIVTQSTDDKPGQVILKHHIKFANGDPQKNVNCVGIQEMDSDKVYFNVSKREEPVIDLLSKRLEDMSPLHKENYFAENVKSVEEKCLTESSLPVLQKMESLNVNSDEDVTESDDDGDSNTPKCKQESHRTGLRAVRSVTNVQIYRDNLSEQASVNSDSESTCDCQSEIFDEVDTNNDPVIIESYEIEGKEGEELYTETDFDDLSVIYEEETEQEKNIILQEVHNSNDDDTSITVRLPLRLSFNNEKNIATVEVGNSHIEDKKSIIDLLASHRSFEGAQEEEFSDIDDTSKSLSISFEHGAHIDREAFAALTVADKCLPSTDLQKTSSGNSEDSSPLSIGNNYMDEILEGDTNDNTPNGNNDLDFFATLLATKLQAQKAMEQSTNLWGKLDLPKNTEPQKKFVIEGSPEEDYKKHDYDDHGQKHDEVCLNNSEEGDCCALIKNSKDDCQQENKRKPKEIMTFKVVKKVKYAAKAHHFFVEDLIKPEISAESFIESTDGTGITQKPDPQDSIGLWSSVDNSETLNNTTESSQNESPIAANNPSSWNYSYNKEFDRTKYPLEPREVDTDEEIDFWAEIETKESPNDKMIQEDEDLNFFKASSFWVEEGRKISIEETPYKTVVSKAYPNRLPNHANAKMFDSCTSALATNGKEATIVDPDNNINIVPFNTKVSPYLALHTEKIQNKEDSEKNLINNDNINNVKTEKDRLEMQRNDNHNTMDFSKKSINEITKEQVVLRKKRYDRKANRNSMILESQPTTPEIAYRKTRSNENLAATNEPFSDETKNKRIDFISKKIANESGNNKELHIEATPSSTLLIPSKGPNNGNSPGSENRPIRERISAFENMHTGILVATGTLSRNNSSQRSESEIEEDDSGVTDMNKPLSGTDTESESFPELRKMSSYQRAATHSRLFKLLQDENELLDDSNLNDEQNLRPSRRKIVHNVSITRKLNPSILTEAETMNQRRERLSLPLQKNSSIDADNPSSPNSPASPISNKAERNEVVSDKLVNELVRSLLLKSDGKNLKNISMVKLQAAAKRVLEEEIESLDSKLTSNEIGNQEKTYDEYYNTWSDACGTTDVIPSKSFRSLQDTHRRSPWSARCPRVLSSKTVNRDLARVTESPEIKSRKSKSPECFSLENVSVSRWRKL